MFRILLAFLVDWRFIDAYTDDIGVADSIIDIEENLRFLLREHDRKLIGLSF